MRKNADNAPFSAPEPRIGTPLGIKRPDTAGMGRYCMESHMALSSHNATAPNCLDSSVRSPAILLAGMFILVVGPSSMNLSISAVGHDLGTTVKQSAVGLRLVALVSAAFILIDGKAGAPHR